MDTERTHLASEQGARYSTLVLRTFTEMQKNQALPEIDGEKKNKTSIC